MFIYPAVGRLIFASYLEVALQTCSDLFDSPRPFLTLGSGIVLRRGVRITSLEDWPPHPTASPLGSSQCYVEFNFRGVFVRRMEPAIDQAEAELRLWLSSETEVGSAGEQPAKG